LPASDVADERFVCVTGPSSPGLFTRIETFAFVGAIWFEVAFAVALWFVAAFWSPPCDCPAPVSLPAWVCLLPWLVLFELPAAATADEVFVCVAEPLSPGLFTRTFTFVFVGATWSDVAAAFEAWAVVASCLVDCDCPPEPAPD
jgi:hypothetical protein